MRQRGTVAASLGRRGVDQAAPPAGTQQVGRP